MSETNLQDRTADKIEPPISRASSYVLAGLLLSGLVAGVVVIETGKDTGPIWPSAEQKAETKFLSDVQNGDQELHATAGRFVINSNANVMLNVPFASEPTDIENSANFAFKASGNQSIVDPLEVGDYYGFVYGDNSNVTADEQTNNVFWVKQDETTAAANVSAANQGNLTVVFDNSGSLVDNHQRNVAYLEPAA